MIDEFVHCPTKTTNYLRRCDRTYMFDCECVLVCVSSDDTHLHVWWLRRPHVFFPNHPGILPNVSEFALA